MVSYFILLRNTFIMFLFASKEWPPHDMHRKRPVTRSFPYTFYPITLVPNGINESLAILKNCRPNGIPTIVIHQMHPAKIHASPPNMPPNINHRIFPKVLISASPLTPFQTLPAIHYFVNSLPHRSPAPVIMPEFHCSDYHIR